jgi:hypothetical protein
MTEISWWCHSPSSSLLSLAPPPQDCDIPFEPVYLEGGSSGEKTWMAPSLNYHEKRAPWQQYIDQKIYKQE